MSKEKTVYLGLPKTFKDLIQRDWPQLADYELDVIKFEAKVELRQSGNYLFGHQELYLPLPKGFKRGDKHQFFVVKKEKI